MGRKKSSQKPIEEVLYPQRFSKKFEEEFVVRRTEIEARGVAKPVPYRTDFSVMRNPMLLKNANAPGIFLN